MSLFIEGRRVRLQALLREPRNAAPRGAALVCHPHPLYGGSMDNRVVFRSAKGILDAGWAALRFNFRGVGASTGAYDHGEGEKADVGAVADWLEVKYPGQPLLLAGFSFGSWVGLQVGCLDPRIRAMIGLGLPLNHYDFDFLLENEKPTLYIIGSHDEFCELERLRRFTRLLPSASTMRIIEGADHFFKTQLDDVQHFVTSFVLGLGQGEA